MILLRDAPVSFLVGMFLLLGEACFVGRAWPASGAALLADRERSRDEIRKAFLGPLAIPGLASRVACDDPDRAFLAHPRSEALLENRPLFIGERLRFPDVPRELYAR